MRAIVSLARGAYQLHTALTFWLLTIASNVSLAQNETNETVGDNVLGDNWAFAFAPYLFAGDSGEEQYRAHVGSSPGTGQQYAYLLLGEYSDPSTKVPSICTVARFYTAIRDETNFLGTLLISTHGGSNALAIEPFEKTAAGMAARDTRYQAYLAGSTGIPGLPVFTAAEVFKSTDEHAYAVGIKAAFIQNYGRLTRGLVYIAACEGGTLTDEFVAANARVSLGNTDCPFFSQDASRVTTFFSRMDGKAGRANRPVSAAKAGLPLAVAGLENTTLAPSVLSLVAPCPITTGDHVTYTFDTKCGVETIPDIACDNCTIENEVWLNPTTLRGICTAAPPPGSFDFELTLPWTHTLSANNKSRLDGNQNPPGSNAEGPAHDDYVQRFTCPLTSQGCCWRCVGAQYECAAPVLQADCPAGWNWVQSQNCATAACGFPCPSPPCTDDSDCPSGSTCGLAGKCVPITINPALPGGAGIVLACLLFVAGIFVFRYHRCNIEGSVSG